MHGLNAYTNKDLDKLVCTYVFETEFNGDTHSYSSNIMAAWDVVKRFGEMGYTVHMERKRKEKIDTILIRPKFQ